MIKDSATEWLTELFEYVVEVLSPDYEQVILVVAASFGQAMREIQNRENVESRETGITAIVRDVYREEPKYEYPSWKSGAIMSRDFFFLIEKPQRIREQGSTYEDVTEGMAHEISEAIVAKHKQYEWTNFSQDQIALLSSYHRAPLSVLEMLEVFARERLADKLSAQHGFGREMFCSLDERTIATYVSFLNAGRLGSGTEDLPDLAMEALAWDKSVSLHAAGQSELADSYLEVWSTRVGKYGEIYRKFMDHYKEVRQRFLSMPLTANSLLVIRNSEFIESA